VPNEYTLEHYLNTWYALPGSFDYWCASQPKNSRFRMLFRLIEEADIYGTVSTWNICHHSLIGPRYSERARYRNRAPMKLKVIVTLFNPWRLKYELGCRSPFALGPWALLCDLGKFWKLVFCLWPPGGQTRNQIGQKLCWLHHDLVEHNVQGCMLIASTVTKRSC
jgi:hypothetical protein